MSRTNPHEVETDEQAEARWRGLYRLAALGVSLALVLTLVDIGLSSSGWDVEVGVMAAQDWFALYQRSWLIGLRNLGFINVITFTLSIPLYLALYRLHRKAAPAYAGITWAALDRGAGREGLLTRGEALGATAIGGAVHATAVVRQVYKR